MTLERHRSKLIPDIDFSGDGRLFVTDREGTFPLRHKDSKKKSTPAKDIDWKTKDGDNNNKDGEPEMREKHGGAPFTDWEYDPDYRIFDDLSSYRSFDPKRDDKSRKYKQKNTSNYEKAMREITGTISSRGSSSLNRRLRRSKSQRSAREREGRFGSMRSANSTGSGNRFRRGQKPEMPPEMRQSLQRDKKRYRSLDVNELRKANRNREYNNNIFDSYALKKAKANGYGPTSDKHFETFDRILREEKLDRVIFLVLGTILIVCGVLRLLLSQWHEYFHSLWTGALILCVGVLSIFHKGHYLSSAKNICFIVLSALSAIATMVAIAISLQVLVPLTREFALESNHTLWIEDVQFSYWDDPLIDTSFSTRTMIYISLVLDYVSLVLCLIGFYSLTAMLVCVDNYMDATHHLTGECDHRGNPRFFNPLTQMSLTQASILIGIVVMAIQVPDHAHYWSPLWAPLTMFFAAFASIFFGKRPDLSGLGWLSTLLQVLGMLTCGVATVVMTLGLVATITEFNEDDTKHKEGELIVCGCFEAGFILLMIVNLVFSVGVVFRHFRMLCCAECFEDYDYNDYKKGEPHYDVRL